MRLEEDIFAFLCRKYVQRSDDRQKAMGLQYTEAETHDLAHEITLYVESLNIIRNSAREKNARTWALETKQFQRIVGTPETPLEELIAEALTWPISRQVRAIKSAIDHRIVAEVAKRAGEASLKK